MMREETLVLDDVRGLFGILTLPDNTRPKAPVLVLPTAGLIHRVGPFRLHVHIARALAEDGFASLRLDKPGAGDMPRQEDLDETGVLRLAMDSVTHYTDIKQFALGGLCSAADTAWRLTLDDERIRGLLMIDGLANRGLWYTIGRLQRKLRQPPVDWVPDVMRRLQTPRTAGGAPSTSRVDMLAYRNWPPMNMVNSQMHSMLQRDVEVLVLYTGSSSYLLNPRQIGTTFGNAVHDKHFQSAFWADCDHTFMLRPHRERLIAAVRKWMLRISAR